MGSAWRAFLEKKKRRATKGDQHRKTYQFALSQVRAIKEVVKMVFGDKDWGTTGNQEGGRG